MDGYSEFGLKARSTMLQKGITMTSLAKEVGVSCMYLSELLRGTRGKRTIGKYQPTIAKILGMEED
jgi:transcriptional regulator with XRE-family HTH domain